MERGQLGNCAAERTAVAAIQRERPVLCGQDEHGQVVQGLTRSWRRGGRVYRRERRDVGQDLRRHDDRVG